ncbi:MAG: hypothetical protein QOH62_1540 [Solirubrobacteraceae bacterium]|jgi:hypothetical protein|nr:hypothetical protein [Solirubrobacteraceae bacterium]
MPGSVFLIALVVIALVLIVLGASTVFLIPIVVLGLAAIFAVPLLGLFGADRDRARHGGGSDPSGVPSTSEASYDPVQEP